ncbi:putative ATP-dependent RNA helicase [Candidatus Protofrankia datiscae]|uniref:Putative ATP-dependent RNA helicase n=2 Tax=Frankiaceae TaxID=74712 RepID=F8AZD5_9ACTN|nr:putative ATP-dependent RNA helicase [Candidatus Protofrankia datiscae]
MRIGLWGATSSGKTTYLGALKLAAEQARGRTRWKVTSKDPVALSRLSELAHVLAVKRTFPEGTQHGTNTRLSWSFLGQKQTGPAGGGSQVEFALDFLDVSGKLFEDQWTGGDENEDGEDELDFDEVRGELDHVTGNEAAKEQLVEHLVACDGIIYLFDPVREEENGNSFQYFNQVLDEVVSRTFDNGRLVGNRLPHQLAVCVTKFDDPRVLGRATSRRELEALAETPGQPKIRAGVAFRYFNMLCHERPDNSAQNIRDSIVSNFHRDRVSFHATSSIGFYIGANNRFDPADYANIVSEHGQFRIRTRPQPMNVLEPLVRLVGRIRRTDTSR